MRNISDYFLKPRNIASYGEISFLLGIFFLPSTLFIGVLFLLPSAIIGSFADRKGYFQDKWNISFFCAGLLMILSTIMHNIFLENLYENSWNSNLSVFGLANWIPFFWLFWAFQRYTESKAQRKRVMILLISGTFPILISGFGQYFFDWTGPYKIFNGLIVWYQKPIIEPAGLSGLFSNQNYAGSWFNLVWPFCIALVLEKSQNFLRKSVAISFLISIGFSAFLTNSRNAWSGLVISLPIVIGSTSLIWLLPFMGIFLIIIAFCTSNLLSGGIQDFLRELIPSKIWLEFSKEGFKDLNVSRLQIFIGAIKLILQRPFFGFGAASFPIIYELQTTFWKGHSHNLPLEIAVSYGLPSALIITFTTFLILYFSVKKIFVLQIHTKIDFYERAWWSSIFVFIISQSVDIQYFDGKISILFWILLGGLRNIIRRGNAEYSLTE
tara:strand:+ start:65 stop:1378 length:1314 start_codon:yes stop_codon:yes gene_type:complete